MSNLLAALEIDGLSWAIIIVAILLGIAMLVAYIIKGILLFRYVRYNRTKTTNGLNSNQVARALLDGLGMQNVKVVKAKWWQAFLFGNHYSMRKKEVRLLWNIYDKDSLTAIALASQKVALAVQDKEGNKKFRVRAKLEPYAKFAPIAFLPILLVSMLLDVLLMKTVGTVTIIGTLLGFAYFVVSFILVLLNIPVEKRANAEAVNLLSQSNLLTAEENEKVVKIYRIYLWNYIIDFIVSILEIILEILKIIAKLKANKE